MISTRLYLGIATLGVLVAPIISFPQDIKFGDSPTTFGDSNDDNVKPKINGCPEFCPSDYTPVCGNDGRTYSNRCELNRARCNRRNPNQQLSISYIGECNSGCPEFCPSDYTPVCGNDGRTYSNRCELSKARCNRSNQNQQLSVSYNGECDSGSGDGNNDDVNEKRFENCCCVSVSRSCPNPRNNGGSSGGNSGFLSAASPRFGPEANVTEDDIGSRIVNKPTEISQQQKEREYYCESHERTCCYDSRSTLNSVTSQSRCIQRTRPSQKNPNVFWDQKCFEKSPNRIQRGEKRCGERRFREISNKKQGQANPAEFPWTCLVLDQNNNFVGSCAIIPDNQFNDVRSGTDRVILAAHKLKDIRNPSQLKVRVIEYDASGFKQTENTKHKEYQVASMVSHPRYDPTRLSFDVAVLKVVTRPDGFGGIKGRIDLTSTDDINAACLPGCDNQFDYQFRNGTGVRCWVAGWGKDGKDGNFQIIQNKVDVPLMNSFECQDRMKQALGRDAGRNFQLSESEVCAGGEEGKDACDGDGGAPLVCLSKDNRWNVVGIVTWGVDCARKGVPGVYANIANDKVLNFILSA